MQDLQGEACTHAKEAAQAMNPMDPPAHLVQLRQGDQVEVFLQGYPPYNGIVEDVALQFRVAWIRDVSIGERKMVLLDECSIRLHDIPAPHSPP